MWRLALGVLVLLLTTSSRAQDGGYPARIEFIREDIVGAVTLDSNLEISFRLRNHEDALYFRFSEDSVFNIDFECDPHDEANCVLAGSFGVSIGGRPGEVISWRLCRNIYNISAYEEMSIPQGAVVDYGPQEGNPYGYMIRARCGPRELVFEARALSDHDRLHVFRSRRGDSVEVRFLKFEPRIAIVNGKRARIISIVFRDP